MILAEDSECSLEAFYLHCLGPSLNLCHESPWLAGIQENNNNNDDNNRTERRNSRLFTITPLRREPSPTRTLKWPRRNRVQITCNTLGAYHVQHAVLCAMWYEGTAQLYSLTEFKSLLFELYSIG